MPKPLFGILSPARLLIILATLFLCGFSWFTPTWESINGTIDRKYAEVPNITTNALLTKIENKEQLTIADVREREEYDVSHLPDAIHLTNADDVQLPKETTIVAYCSVGLRSAIFAEKLQKRGYTHVYNLRGSIFEWAEKGYPLYSRGERTSFVHPYDEKWGTLVRSSLHAYPEKK